MFFFDTWQSTHLKNLMEWINRIKIKFKRMNWLKIKLQNSIEQNQNYLVKLQDTICNSSFFFFLLYMCTMEESILTQKI